MIEQDTIKLLRECDAGVKMGVASIDDVMDYVENKELKKQLNECKDEHAVLAREIEKELDRFHDDGKEPNPMAKGMSWMKTNVKISMDHSDATIADLLTDGCHMGIKSLHRYMNQYRNASLLSRELCGRLVVIEEELCKELRSYL